MQGAPSPPITREEIEVAFLQILDAVLPAYPGYALQAIFESALRTAKSRLAGDLREAWAVERTSLEREGPGTTAGGAQARAAEPDYPDDEDDSWSGV